MNEVDYKQLIQEGKRYLKLEFNYSKLTAVEKLSILLSSIAVVAVIAILGAFVLIYLASTLTHLIAQAAGAAWVGNLVVAALFVAILLIVLVMKKTIIIDPITRFLTKLLLNPNDNE